MTNVTSQTDVTPVLPILIVDDDVEDVHFIKRAFKKNNLSNPLFSALSGEEALDFLQRSDSEQTVFPGFMLLDLNMPGIGGMETLRRIRLNDRWRKIPVIIFTTSKAQEDIDDAYRLGANCFVSKPFGLEGLVDVVANITSYWFSVAALPSYTLE